MLLCQKDCFTRLGIEPECQNSTWFAHPGLNASLYYRHFSFIIIRYLISLENNFFSLSSNYLFINNPFILVGVLFKEAFTLILKLIEIIKCKLIISKVKIALVVVWFFHMGKISHKTLVLLSSINRCSSVKLGLFFTLKHVKATEKYSSFLLMKGGPAPWSRRNFYFFFYYRMVFIFHLDCSSNHNKLKKQHFIHFSLIIFIHMSRLDRNFTS